MQGALAWCRVGVRSTDFPGQFHYRILPLSVSMLNLTGQENLVMSEVTFGISGHYDFSENTIPCRYNFNN